MTVISPTLLGHVLRSTRVRAVFVIVALFGWGFLMPTVYKQFGSVFKHFADQGLIPKELTNFGGGDVFTLPGAIALGFVHPIAVALVSVFAVGLGTSAIAGERQRGTLEVLLARPVGRRQVYATFLVAVLLLVALAVVALIIGSLVASAIWGVIGEIDTARVPLAILNAVLLYGAYATIALAASVSFDRLAPAAGITVAVLLVTYFLEIIGSLWPDVKGAQPYSLFHYLAPRDVLTGKADALPFLVPAVVAVIAVAYALWEFPRRDIAAPS